MRRIHWSPSPASAPGERLTARAFANEGRDLGIDIDAPLDVALTAVLSACLSDGAGQAVTPEDARTWTVAKRRQGLLAIAVATHGTLRDLTATCHAPACGERMDLQVDLTAFNTDWREDRVMVPGHSLVLRLPSPGDLTGSEAEGPDLLRNLVVEGDVPANTAWLDDADTALGEADPLGDLELQATCPECGAPVSHPFALEPFLMAELAGELSRLIDEIHVLAMAYHWSEAEILALPNSRRALYIDRIREAWAA